MRLIVYPIECVVIKVVPCSLHTLLQATVSAEGRSGNCQQMRHNLFLWFIWKEVQSSVTSTVSFLKMSDPGPKTHLLTSAERKCLQSIKGNADEML